MDSANTIRWLGGLLSFIAIPIAEAQLSVHGNGDGELRLSWQAESFPPTTGVPAKWIYQPEWSTDGNIWRPLGAQVTQTEGGTLSPLLLNFEPPAPTALLRVGRRLEYGKNPSDKQPANYDLQYDYFKGDGELLSRSVSGDTSHCLDSIGWDVTSATFWQEFNTDPDDHNAGRTPDDPERRLSDFRLTAAEHSLFA